MTTKKEQILALRAEGKTYNEIVSIVGCSKGTVSYHCGDGQVEKTASRNRTRRASNPLIKKLDTFKSKSRSFRERSNLRQKNRLGYWKVWTFVDAEKSSDMDFTIKDVIDIHGDNQFCYLTNRPVDLADGDTYQLDHVQPRSRGGSNSIDNLGLVCPEANSAKGKMTLEEFVSLCYDVVENVERLIEESENNN